MNKMKSVAAGMLAATSAMAAVAETEVGERLSVTRLSSSAAYVAATEKCRTLPAATPQPIFWFDCSNTNGWEFSGNTVTKVPSLVGNRYLTLQRYATTSPGWQPLAPTFVTNVAALQGGSMLDFGEANSMKGLLFNAVENSDGSVVSNLLCDIATVVTVMDTSEGGGYFLGGGRQNNNGWGSAAFDGYLWLRGCNEVLGANDTTCVRQSVLGRYPGHVDFLGGYMRHNGMPIFNEYHGFNGEWETLAFRPRLGVGATGRITSHGVSIADSRNLSGVQRGGGQKIAEMLIFSTVLSDEQTVQLEAYLQEKWFGAPKAGWNGNAFIGETLLANNSMQASATAIRLGLNVPDGERLTLATLRGGHRGEYLSSGQDIAGVDKTGDGTLALKDARSFGGDVRVKAGTLDLTLRETPSEPPADLAIHLDASVAGTLVTNAAGAVTSWANLGSGKYQGAELSASALDSARMPTVIANAFGAGKPVVDFGSYHNDGTGAYLSFTTGTDPVQAKVPSVTTVIAILGLQGQGGSIVDGAFSRATQQYGLLSYKDPLLPTTGITPGEKSTGCAAPHPYYLTNGYFYVDGVRRDHAEGYPHRGYMAVAIQCAGSDITAVGAMTGLSNAGGVRIAELLAYDRTLSERQLEDAQAYLMQKWFGRAAPGYKPASGTSDEPTIRTLVMDAPNGEIVVPAGQTVRLQSANLLEPFSVSGGGTLVIDGNRTSGDLVTLRDGSKLAVDGPNQTTAQAEMAADPAFHLDAADTDRMDIRVYNGKNCVTTWYDTNFRNFAYQNDPAFYPWLNETDTLNGHPVVDFGPYAKVTAGSGYLMFCRGENAIRSVFWVVKVKPVSSGTGIPMLGSLGSTYNYEDTAYNAIYDYVRSGTGGWFIKNAAAVKVLAGETRTNGVVIADASVTEPIYGTFQLLENHNTASAHASGLACDRWNGDSGFGWFGGLQLGEVLIYDRVLSEREKVATRNYLRQKWFPDEALEALPAVEPAPNQIVNDARAYVKEIEVADGQAIPNGLVAKRLVGEGSVTLSGEGTVEIKDLSAYTGTVTVAAGTLKLSGVAPQTAQGVVEDGRVFHADATSGVETETDLVGARRVTKWTSRHDSTWTAEPGFAASKPTLVRYPNGDGLAAVDMASDNEECLVFKHNGVTERIGGIRSVFWVIGSQNGGGWLLGGGTNIVRTQLEPTGHRPYNFHRGYSNMQDPLRYTDPSAALLGGWNAYSDKMLVVNADWYRNGAAVNPLTTGLSGDWDLVDFNLKETCDPSAPDYTEAQGFAFDGRTFDDSASRALVKKIAGCQRLAEVIVYNRRLTEAERLQNEAYLKAKWGVGVHAAATTGASVSLASGAVLDLNGSEQNLVSVTGSGTIRNGDFAPNELVADYLDHDYLTVEGTFTVRSGLTVRLANFAGVTETCFIPILKADSYDGLSNLATANFVGDIPSSLVRLKIQQGVLGVKVAPGGLMLYVR